MRTSLELYRMADEPERPDDDFSRERHQDERFERLLTALQRTPQAYEGGAHGRGIDSSVLKDIVRGLLAERVAVFLTREQITELVRNELERAGLRVDDAHVDDTAESIRGAMRWHRLASRAWMAAAGTIIMGFVYSLARKAGLPVPSGS